MNLEGLEKAEGKVCSKCGQWKPLEEYYKDVTKEDGRRTACKECVKKQSKQHYQNNKEKEQQRKKQYRENNKERMKEYLKQYYENNKEHIKEKTKQWRENNPNYNKQWRENNKEYKEYNKQWRENNPDYNKQWRKNNKEYYKEYFKNNIEHHRECDKKSREKRKENNLQYISNMLEQINPIFKQLNLSVYGYVYMFENVKTGHKYLGQSTLPIARRYKGGIIQGWIKERLKYDNQKFKDELIEADIKVTEILDVAFCQYHLDKLEAYYIDKYDSYNNGYNNYAGNHNTNDGLEEFNKILSQYNIEFIDGEIKEKRLPKQA